MTKRAPFKPGCRFNVQIRAQKFPFLGGVAKIQRIFDGVVNHNLKISTDTYEKNILSNGKQTV
ncbi:hypothetical protein EB354_11325 [Chryseobacterium balustinum]|nr:hypothetical protein EB354_11325 [Chryseobacterium balustinum]